MRTIVFLLYEITFQERHNVMSLSAVLKQRGHRVHLLRANRLPFRELVARLAALRPDIVAYSLMSFDARYARDLNRALRKQVPAFTIAGGVFPTFSPDFLREEGIDAVCVGEGEAALAELADRLGDPALVRAIPNLHVKQDGVIHRNELRPLHADLSTLPFPDRELMYEGEPLIRDNPIKTFLFGRGCVYKCSYCMQHKYRELYANKGQWLRFKSIPYFIEEIRRVRERYPLEFIFIWDDTLTMMPEAKLEEFVETYRREINLPFRAQTRVNLVVHNPRIPKLLRAAGCHCLTIGVECGDEEIANRRLHRDLTNEQIVAASRLIKESGIRLLSLNVLGLPVPDPLAIDRQTLDLNVRIQPDASVGSLYYPFIGTRLWQETIRDGYFREVEYDDENMDYLSRSYLDWPDPATKPRVQRLQKLFPIAIQFPWLRPLLPFLIRLPLHGFYRLLFFAFEGYKERFVIGAMKLNWRTLWMNLRILASVLKPRREKGR